MFSRMIFVFAGFLGFSGVWAEEIRFDFEADLQNWKLVEGFVGDLRSDREFFHNHPTVRYNKEGKFYLSTLENRKQPNDGFRGMVESPIWENTGNEVTLRVGGGSGKEVSATLCLLEGDECTTVAPNVREIFHARGQNKEEMVEVRWNTESLHGKNLFIRLSDNATGGWGHITLDDVRAEGILQPELTQAYRKVRRTLLTDLPPVVEIVPTVPDAGAKDLPELTRQPILYVARKQYRRDHHNTATMFQTGEINTRSFTPGAALRIADFSQKDAAGNPKITTLLETETGLVRDPEVSFDGTKILFSMRQNKEDDYHIWEMNADGSGLRQITFGQGISDIDPIYLSDGKILFSSTREPKYCMCNRHIMCNLYTMNADGSDIQQIGHSTLFEGHASLLSDGRVIYDRWEYVDRNFGDAQGLWVTNPDGTQHLLFWGNNTASPGGVLEAREIPGTHLVICTFSSCHDRPWGAIAILDRNKGVDGRQAVKQIWPPEAIQRVDVGGYDQFVSLKPKYEDPYPLTQHHFLASRQMEGERMGMVLLDDAGHETVIWEERELGIYDPMPLAARPVPRLLEPRMERSQKNGTFYVSDVYQSQEMQAVQRGEVHFLRVVESPEKRYFTAEGWDGGTGEQAPAMTWNDFNNKRILGTVPVEEDGSAHFEVPADTFVYFQLLDKDGRMLHSMRSGTIVRPGERQGCIGCHEDRLNAVPPRRVVKALLRPADTLKLPTWIDSPRDFNYMTEIQPIWNQHCIQCHDWDGPGAKSVVLAGDRNILFNASYCSIRQREMVNVPGAGPTKTLPAKSWGSTTSRLGKVVWSGHGDERDTKFSLTPEEKDRVMTWIDLNAPYYPTYASNYHGHLFGRSPLTNAELARLTELTGVPFLKTGDGWANNNRWNHWMIALERPEKSPCLAKLNADSAEYREAVEILSRGAKRLEERPRADMPNFRMMDPDDLRREAKYQELLKK